MALTLAMLLLLPRISTSTVNPNDFDDSLKMKDNFVKLKVGT